mmetsp:Transcript_3513/g.5871  ORF Transcript_3513/g.5871 Transcript_3513/m.5871 type:complete len:340 (+) Transcript_3513:81-1100(+)
MSSSNNNPISSRFDELLDQVDYLASSDDDDDDEEEDSPSLRGGLTSLHLDPIASRNWKSVLSWIAFHPDEVATLVDREGQTSLHHACLFRAPLNVVEAMLFAAPELATVPNDEGELALHWAVRLSLPLQVLTILLTANPTSGFVKDQRGQTPLSLLWDRHEATLVDVYRIYGRERVTSFPGWKRIMMLVEAYAKNDANIEQYPLHAIVKCPCEASFLRFATQMLHDETDRRDTKENLPLHLACSAPLDVDLLSIVLNANPDASSLVDGKEQLPLHLAIASGKGWQEGVEIIFNANPASLGHVDSEHRLYPFMLAGVSDQACNSTIYALLRANPEYVMPL